MYKSLVPPHPPASTTPCLGDKKAGAWLLPAALPCQVVAAGCPRGWGEVTAAAAFFLASGWAEERGHCWRDESFGRVWERVQRLPLGFVDLLICVGHDLPDCPVGLPCILVWEVCHCPWNCVLFFFCTAGDESQDSCMLGMCSASELNLSFGVYSWRILAWRRGLFFPGQSTEDHGHQENLWLVETCTLSYSPFGTLLVSYLACHVSHMPIRAQGLPVFSSTPQACLLFCSSHWS